MHDTSPVTQVGKRRAARYRVLRLLALAPSLLLLFSVPFASEALAAGVQPISSDPVSGDGAQHATEVDPEKVAINGTTIVSVFQVGRYAGGSSAIIGWATSMDGGSTWTHGFLPSLTHDSTPAGPNSITTDPSIAYDAVHGVFLITAQVNDGSPNQAEVVSRSTDGTSWSAPITISSANRPDKNWLACDNWPSSPFRGTCYAAFAANSLSNRLLASTSTDGGSTWSAAVPTVNSATGYNTQIVIQPSGTAVVVATNAAQTR